MATDCTLPRTLLAPLSANLMPLGPGRVMFTVAQSALYSGFSVRTLRRYIADGRLPIHRFGPRLIRIDPDELDKLIISLPSSAL